MSPVLTHLLIGLLGAIALLLVWRRTAALAGPFDEDVAAEGTSPDRAGLELAALPGIILEATGSRFAADFRLRPLLRQLASDRMRQRHGVDFDADPATAEALLGRTAWDYLRADRPIVRDFRAPGIAAATLEEIVAAVERL
jgi:hypothetical protein